MAKVREALRSVSLTSGALQLGAVVATFLYAGASQNNGSAYLLAFSSVAIAAVGGLFAWRNLAEVNVRIVDLSPAYAEGDGGETLPHSPQIRLSVRDLGRRGCYGCRVAFPELAPGSQWSIPPIAPSATREVVLSLPPMPRGLHPIGTVQVESLYPFGFLRVRRPFSLDHDGIVIYPAPLLNPPPFPASSSGWEGSGGVSARGDDFIGVRPYQLGESQRHVDWKAVARGHPMKVKQFGGGTETANLVDWDALSGEPEWKLRALCTWLLEHERLGIRYALKLPGGESPFGKGAAHLHQQLRRLATFPGAPFTPTAPPRRRRWWSKRRAS